MTSIISSITSAFSPKAELNPLDDRYYETGYNFGPSLAGVNVSRTEAMRQAVFYRCIAIRAQAFAQLPIGVYMRGEKTRTEIPDDPLSRAFTRPNPWQTSFSWRREVWCDFLLGGHAYNQIVYGPGSRLSFVPLDADRMKEITKEGDKVRTYEFTRKNGQKVTLEGDRDVWHLEAMNGRGLVDLARETLGLAISTQNHASLFMRRGVKSTGVLEHPGRLKPETAREMGQNFNAAYGGQAGHGKVPVLYEGMKFNALTMNNQDAQFAELKLSTLEELATFCGVAPYMVGMIEKQTSWGSGVEEQNLTFIQFTLGPDCTLFEQEAARVFLDADREDGTNGRYVRMNQGAFLKGKHTERAQFYKTLIDAHVMLPNQARELEDWDPIEGGDKFPAVPGAINGTEEPKSDEEPPAKPKVVKAEIENPGFKTATLAAWHEGPVIKWKDLGRLQHLAAMVASELLNTEARDMAEIAKTTATDSAKWANAIRAYHGRRAGSVAETLSITKEQAEAYCKEQARLAAEGGARVLDTWAKDHAGRVVSLALGTSTTFPVKE